MVTTLLIALPSLKAITTSPTIRVAAGDGASRAPAVAVAVPQTPSALSVSVAPVMDPRRLNVPCDAHGRLPSVKVPLLDTDAFRVKGRAAKGSTMLPLEKPRNSHICEPCAADSEIQPN